MTPGGRRASRPARGIVLLLLCSLLVLLATVATAVLIVSERGRHVGRLWGEGARASLLARSGIERAVSQIRIRPPADYRGEDYDADGVLNPDPTSMERSEQTVRPGDLDIETCPVEHALRPSLFSDRDGNTVGAGIRAPDWTVVDGRRRGFSGRLRGTYEDEPGARGDTYAVKAVRTGGIHINGGDLTPGRSGDPAAGYNRTLHRILGTLADTLDVDEDDDGLADDPGRDGTPVSRADGEALIAARPAGGWLSWDQVRDAALGGSETKMAALRPYLVREAWVDRKVVAPNASAAIDGRDYQTWAALKSDRPAVALAASPMDGTRAPDFERNAAGAVVGRAPIDLDWARSRRPVLIALFAGLEGVYLDGRLATSPFFGDRIGRMARARLPLDWAAPSDPCRDAVRALMDASPETEPLSTWDRWDDFWSRAIGVTSGEIADRQADVAAQQAVRDAAWAAYLVPHNAWTAAGAPPSGPLFDARAAAWAVYQAEAQALTDALAALAALFQEDDALRARADLIRSNFNPNPVLNKFAPDASRHRAVDKSDLLAYSTEFSLVPSAGWSLDAAGRVTRGGGALLAMRIVRAQTAPARRACLTTQAEFAAGDLGSLQDAGDESSFRAPGEALYVSESAGPERTFGHALAIDPAGYLDGSPSARGASLQTGPEPHTVARPAAYDGYLRLATNETEDREMFAPAVPPGSSMRFLARWDAGLDASLGGGGLANLPDVLQPAATRSLWDAASPGTFLPDGVYLERGRELAYASAGNMTGSHGVVSFWVRMNHAVRDIPLNADYNVQRRHLYVNGSYVNAGAPVNSAIFWIGNLGKSPTQNGTSHGFACMFEQGHPGDANLEVARATPVHFPPPRRWRLVSVLWDNRTMARDDSCRLRVDSGAAADDRNTAYAYAGGGMMGSGFDFSAHGEILHLGKRGPVSTQIQHTAMLDRVSSPDATFDEFALYDFGPDTGAGIVAYDLLAVSRHQAGRYYKGSAYPAAGGLLAPPGPARDAAEYFSAPVSLGPGRARILGISWTQHVPPDLRAPADPGPAGRVVLDLAEDPVGGVPPGYARDASGAEIRDLLADDAYSAVGRSVDAPFRIHAVFQPNLDAPDNTPILDPLLLDDVTILYRRDADPWMSSWTEE